jgi:glycosyltransferase involved in cell wall biosynthesis
MSRTIADSQPLVSVIIPTHNRADLLPRAIKSVFNQTYDNYEIIVVDDGSTDDTGTVVKALCDDYDERLRFIRQINQGSCAARNHGLRLAKGEFVLFLDSDDLIAPDKLALQVEQIKRYPNVDFSIGKSVWVESDGKTIAEKQLPEPKEDFVTSQIESSWFLISAPLWRRSSLDMIGPWDERLPGGQDWEFHVRALLYGLNVSRCEEAIDYCRLHSGPRVTPKSWTGIPGLLACSVLWERVQRSEYAHNVTPARRAALWNKTLCAVYAVMNNDGQLATQRALTLLKESSWGWRRIVAYMLIASYWALGSLPARVFRKMKYRINQPLE